MNTIQKTITPFESSEFEYTVEYTPLLSQLTLASRQPDGMIERFESGEIEMVDVDYFEYILDSFTNIESNDLRSLSSTQFLYLVTTTVNTIVGEETMPFGEFVEETEVPDEKFNFAENEILGVR